MFEKIKIEAAGATVLRWKKNSSVRAKNIKTQWE